jgi:glucose/arabinose dehydrogenase
MKIKFILALLIFLLLLSLSLVPAAISAPSFADTKFKDLWEYSDKRVNEIPNAGRSYTWGPQTLGVYREDYQNAPGGKRQVQYFDKSRMELSANGSFVTNGLLTKELVTGRRQDGDSLFTPLAPATVPVVGDVLANDTAPTYASFQKVVSFAPGENSAPNRIGQNATQAIGKDGTVSNSNLSTEITVYDGVFGHNVPRVFVNFQNQTGLVWKNNRYEEGKIYTDNPTANVFGFAISEPYWTKAKVAGVDKDVLVQLFERRILTYTPSNAPEFQVEMGNIGLHYLRWRYGDVSVPQGASVRVKVDVPQNMRSAPFNVDRYLNVPPDFSISVYARVAGARFMAVAPNNDLLVSVPSAGKIVLLRPNDSTIYDFATNLRRPHDIVFHSIGNTMWVYIAETHQINRYVYTTGDTSAKNRQVIITGLPDGSTPELRGSYGHELKNIALDKNNNLYVSIASTCNACLSDTQSDPVRGSIYQYSADGSNPKLFASGIRNAEGLAFVPDTTDLWVVVNNRDNIAYPYNDATGNYGKVIPAFVDNNPPELFTRVRDGGNYGWPFCNSNPNSPSGMDNMPYDPDYELNRENSRFNCAIADKVNKGIQAHTAPLGLLFLQNTNFPAAYRNGAVTALHGSWNRTQKAGAKVIFFVWRTDTQTAGDQLDLANGWIDEANQSYWGRPVDIAVDQQGSLFISDDHSGTIYKLTKK